MIGRRLSHYRIVEKLGEGGMGEVFRAQDLNLKRDVALKVLAPDTAMTEDVEQRFFREARTLATITHPNIVTVHDFGEEDGYRFLAMEFVEGTTLEQKIESRPEDPQGLPDDAELLNVALPLVDALSAAHERGVIHRDLKPGNVMIAQHGRLKVLDFGVAKLRQSDWDERLTQTDLTTQAGLLLGTVPYMSPEQIEGREVDHRSDLFSLGVMLYELATGVRPFTGKTPMAVLSSILRDTPAPLRQVAPQLSERLVELIERCLEKDPNERHPSTSELHFDLDTLRRRLESQDVRLSGPLPTASELYRRKRLTWVAVALVGLSLAGLGIWKLTSAPATDPLPIAASPTERDLRERDLLRPRIAVSPFRNVGEPGDAYFAEGVADEISSRLSSLRGLGVVSPSGWQQGEGERVDLQELRDRVGVEYLLDGTVQWSRGERKQVRVIPRLTDLRDDTQIWSEPFVRELEDVFDVQGQIALAVVRALEIGLLKEDRARLERTPTEDSQAYLTYLRGRHFWRQRGAGLRRSLEYFEQAARIDPEFALAHLGVADAYALFAIFGNMPAGEALPLALEAADRAVTLDPSLAEAYATLGFAKLLYSRDWQAAEEEFEVSLELSPNYPEGRRWYALHLVCLGAFDRGIEQADTAVEIDPLSPQAIGNKALVLVTARRYAEAIQHIESYLEFHSDYPVGYWLLGWAQIRAGEVSEGVAAIDRALELSDQPLYLAHKGVGFAAAGRDEEALGVIAELLARSQKQYIRPYLLALVYSELRDLDQTLAWLERSLEENDIGLIFIGVVESFDWLRDEPRFIDLLTRSGHEVEPGLS